MIERLETTLKRFNEINSMLMDPEITSDINKIRELSKEQSDLNDIVSIYTNYKRIIEDIENTKEMINDPDLKDLAAEELEILKIKKQETESEIELILLPKDPNDEKDIIMEIRGAAGGDEANIFAGDLYRMYAKYAERQNWKIEAINSIESESGGFSKIEIMIKGTNVYSKLKYESGAHRVQRVPKTESQGRVHTSTATVVVMPEADDVDIEIKPGDLKIDVYRSSGAGGQCVNTTDSAVRITHLPTDTVVTCQNEKSQIKNREAALKVLKARLYEIELRKQEEVVGNERKNQIGTGDRSEKIRTYNYPQNRVTDHRIGYTTKQLDRVMEGHIDEIIIALINEEQKRMIEGKE